MQSRSTLPRVVLVVAPLASLSHVATAQSGPQPGPEPEVLRLAGADRVGTAVAIAQVHAPHGTVVIARADDFPDALAGAHLGVPILLTEPDRLPEMTRSALDGVTAAIVLGGPAAVAESLVAELESTGVAVTRLAGAERIETAAAVATLADAVVGTVDGRPTALLASAGTFADALVAGPFAAGASFPLLLTDPDDLSSVTRDALAALEVEQVLIVGGPAAVSAQVLASVQGEGLDVRRLAGGTRQETAVAVAEFAADELGWPVDVLALATGADFPDALAMGPLAGARQAPLLLTGGDVAADAVGLLGCGVAQVIVAGGLARLARQR